MKKTILFDLDGTLIDSTDAILNLFSKELLKSLD
ncbi:HAD hydrolase-like protein [Campylobacter coli]